jgi:hypothetical protein
VLLAGCGSDPGPLAGTWQSNGSFSFQITFRPGETEALGMIEKVSYRQDGRDIIVTSEDGPMKGTATRYTPIDANTVKTSIWVLRRVKQ